MTRSELEADLLKISRTLELVNKVQFEPLFATEETKKEMKEHLMWLFKEFNSACVDSPRFNAAVHQRVLQQIKKTLDGVQLDDEESFPRQR